MHKKRNRLIAALLTLAMCLSIISPLSAFADEPDDSNDYSTVVSALTSCVESGGLKLDATALKKLPKEEKYKELPFTIIGSNVKVNDTLANASTSFKLGGTVVVSTTIVLNLNGKTLLGPEEGATIKVVDGGDLTVTNGTISGITGIEVTGGKLTVGDNVTVTGTNTGVSLSGDASATITNSTINGATYGIYITGNASCTTENTTIAGNTANSDEWVGVKIYNGNVDTQDWNNSPEFHMNGGEIKSDADASGKYGYGLYVYSRVDKKSDLAGITIDDATITARQAVYLNSCWGDTTAYPTNVAITNTTIKSANKDNTDKAWAVQVYNNVVLTLDSTTIDSPYVGVEVKGYKYSDSVILTATVTMTGGEIKNANFGFQAEAYSNCTIQKKGETKSVIDAVYGVLVYGGSEKANPTAAEETDEARKRLTTVTLDGVKIVGGTKTSREALRIYNDANVTVKGGSELNGSYGYGGAIYINGNLDAVETYDSNTVADAYRAQVTVEDSTLTGTGSTAVYVKQATNLKINDKTTIVGGTVFGIDMWGHSNVVIDGESTTITAANGVRVNGYFVSEVTDGTQLYKRDDDGYTITSSGARTSDVNQMVKAGTGNSALKKLGPKLTIENGTITSTNFAVGGNGMRYYTTITINGGTIDGTTGDGIYHPQTGVLNINGGVIKGTGSAVGIKTGVLNMTGGELIATGPDETPTTGWSNGINASGAALQIEANDGYGTNNDTDVTTGTSKTIVNITGGKITSQQGYAIYEYIGIDKDKKALSTDSHLQSITISEADSVNNPVILTSASEAKTTGTEGTTATKKAVIKTSQDAVSKATFNITGGTFSADLTYTDENGKVLGTYVPNGYYAVEQKDGTYRIEKSSAEDTDSKTITLSADEKFTALKDGYTYNLNGHTLTYTGSAISGGVSFEDTSVDSDKVGGTLLFAPTAESYLFAPTGTASVSLSNIEIAVDKDTASNVKGIVRAQAGATGSISVTNCAVNTTTTKENTTTTKTFISASSTANLTAITLTDSIFGSDESKAGIVIADSVKAETITLDNTKIYSNSKNPVTTAGGTGTVTIEKNSLIKTTNSGSSGESTALTVNAASLTIDSSEIVAANAKNTGGGTALTVNITKAVTESEEEIKNNGKATITNATITGYKTGATISASEVAITGTAITGESEAGATITATGSLSINGGSITGATGGLTVDATTAEIKGNAAITGGLTVNGGAVTVKTGTSVTGAVSADDDATVKLEVGSKFSVKPSEDFVPGDAYIPDEKTDDFYVIATSMSVTEATSDTPKKYTLNRDTELDSLEENEKVVYDLNGKTLTYTGEAKITGNVTITDNSGSDTANGTLVITNSAASIAPAAGNTVDISNVTVTSYASTALAPAGIVNITDSTVNAEMGTGLQLAAGSTANISNSTINASGFTAIAVNGGELNVDQANKETTDLTVIKGAVAKTAGTVNVADGTAIVTTADPSAKLDDTQCALSETVELRTGDTTAWVVYTKVELEWVTGETAPTITKSAQYGGTAGEAATAVGTPALKLKNLEPEADAKADAFVTAVNNILKNGQTEDGSKLTWKAVVYKDSTDPATIYPADKTLGDNSTPVTGANVITWLQQQLATSLADEQARYVLPTTTTGEGDESVTTITAPTATVKAVAQPTIKATGADLGTDDKGNTTLSLAFGKNDVTLQLELPESDQSTYADAIESAQWQSGNTDIATIANESGVGTITTVAGSNTPIEITVSYGADQLAATQTVQLTVKKVQLKLEEDTFTDPKVQEIGSCLVDDIYYDGVTFKLVAEDGTNLEDALSEANDAIKSLGDTWYVASDGSLYPVVTVNGSTKITNPDSLLTYVNNTLLGTTNYELAEAYKVGSTTSSGNANGGNTDNAGSTDGTGTPAKVYTLAHEELGEENFKLTDNAQSEDDKADVAAIRKLLYSDKEDQEKELNATTFEEQLLKKIGYDLDVDFAEDGDSSEITGPSETVDETGEEKSKVVTQTVYDVTYKDAGGSELKSGFAGNSLKVYLPYPDEMTDEDSGETIDWTSSDYTFVVAHLVLHDKNSPQYGQIEYIIATKGEKGVSVNLSSLSTVALLAVKGDVKLPSGTEALASVEPAKDNTGMIVLVGAVAATAVVGGVIAYNWDKLPVHKIEGTVVDANGAAVANATVTLAKNGKVVKTLTTDANGHYTAKVAKGEYEITATVGETSTTAEGSTGASTQLAIA